MLNAVRFKRVTIVASTATLSFGIYQGFRLRNQYVASDKIEPPSGPTAGIEKWMGRIKSIKHDIRDKIEWESDLTLVENTKLLMRRYRDKVFPSEETEDVTVSHKEKSQSKNWLRRFLEDKLAMKRTIPPLAPRNIKLLVIGDSLVSGVGCDHGDKPTSPVLPTILAKVLSIALRADVEWKAEGVIGGTVSDLRKVVVPMMKQSFLAAKDGEQDTEYIVVVICGLNDWKCMIENFPYGAGPAGFHQELAGLISDITEGMKNKCRVFLPALPSSCGESDPGYILNTRPLCYVASTLMYIWDLQKQNVALENDSALFITTPGVNAEYATPGKGNVSRDGIHPSDQGYKWWAMHIAESILQSIF